MTRFKRTNRVEPGTHHLHETQGGSPRLPPEIRRARLAFDAMLPAAGLVADPFLW